MCTSEQHYSSCLACLSSAFSQPTSESYPDLVVCFTDCPTGYTASLEPNLCNESAGDLTLHYDLTWIPQDIPSLGAVNLVASGDIAPIGDNTKAFKMRGRYSAGNGGIMINGLRLHHSFTLSMWVYITQAQDCALFSKVKQMGEALNSENFLDLVYVANGGLLSARLFSGS